MLKGVDVQMLKGLRLSVLVLLPLFLLSCSGTDNSGTAASSRSAQSVLPTNASLAAPGGVTAIAGNGDVTVSWSAVDGATSYNVYYLTFPGKTSDDSHPAVTTANSKQMTAAASGVPITGLANGEIYYFVVTAVNDGGESLVSSEVSAKPMANLPGIPGDVQLDQVASGGVACATVKWQKVANATSYNVYYGTSPGVTTASPNKISSLLNMQTVGGLTVAPGHYYFRVTAVNDSGESAPSVELIATAKSAYKAVAAGYGHSVALRTMDNLLPVDDGSVWTWGNNSSGQLGTGGSPGESLKALKSKTVRATAIASGYDHTVALTTDKAVNDWGRNNYGQLGRSFSTTNSADPLIADTLYDKKAIAAGKEHTVALKSDGTVWTWGTNNMGELGRKSISCLDPHNQQLKEGYTCDSTPNQVYGITGIISAIAAGEAHTLAVDSSGKIWTWGRNDTGQLGGVSYCDPTIMAAIPQDIGFSTTASSSCGVDPIQVATIPAATIAVSAGTRHSVALTSDGYVWTWGGDYYGQLGVTTSTTQLCTLSSSFTMQCTPNPGLVQGLDHIIAIAAGSYHTVALKSDGTVWTWGYNLLGGQIVDVDNPSGSVGFNRTPVEVVFPGTGRVVAIAAGAYHSLALRDDGTVWAWGYNGQGQLGDGSKTDRSTPVKVQGLSAPVVIVPGL